MPSFHEVRFPEYISYGAVGGPKFNTSIFTGRSGHEQRNVNWSRVRPEYRVGQNVNSQELLDVLLEFFYARFGRAYGFRFKDWLDYQLSRQVIGQTDGAQSQFQAFKRYLSGGELYDRTLSKLVAGTVLVWVNDVAITAGAGAGQYQVNVNTGIVTLGATLAAQSGTNVELECEFDVPVRFDVDHMQVSIESFQERDWDGIPIVGIRV